MHTRSALLVALALTPAACNNVRTPVEPDAKDVGVARFAIGQPAPRLEIERWLAGNPVEHFEPGRVYLIEFWATWCTSCIPMFAHLSEIQARYGDRVTVVGVDIWEESYTSATVDDVAAFVTRHATDMRYSVAYDGKAARTDRAYMGAAGRHGVPYAFLVDASGRLAWMGIPTQSGADGMDAVLERLVEGSFDSDEAARNAQAAQPNTEVTDPKLEALISRLTEAYRLEDWDLVLTRLAELDRYQGGSRTAYHMNTFSVLLKRKRDYAAAYAMKDALLATPRIANSYADLNQIAWSVVDPNGTVAAADRDLDFALTFATKADDVAKGEDAVVLNTLARVHWELGHAATAVEVQRKAVRASELAESNVTPERAAEMRTNLAEFERAAGSE